jgi:hypothetical protein
MSVKGADERTEKSGKSKGSAGGVERRAPRVHFEALVAVGEAEGDGGFDAESLDVSREGMRLRAEHLPNVGDKLLCRFDGGAGEIVVEAEVSWRSPEARGGEFGLKFLDVTPEDAEALSAMCASLGLEEGGEGDEADVRVPRGARVRLHIEGLGSPMKARVRESGGRDVEVGSNLEFLKVGRPLELEDAEAGKRTEAYIDSVKVEVDPETRVPQLVVSLRYDKEPTPKTERSTAKGLGAVTARAADGEELEVREGDERGGEARAKLGEAGQKAKAVGAAALSKVGPAAAMMGEKAKGAMSSLLSAIRSKRAAPSDEPERRAGPRRVTAPPPSGVLKADGKRLVREDGGDEMPMSEAPQKKNRKALVVGGLVGLLAVAGIVGATKLRQAPAPVAALPQTTAVASGDPMNANVPLFGATPMSTTETVPTALPTAQPEAAAPKALAKADADDDGELKKEWGEGSVKSPLVLKLKLDGEADGFHASSGDNGFTLEVPGRKFLGNASELAKKDKRIGSINVTNNPEGAEIVVQFKDTPPAYVARVKGERLEIALGRDKKVAKKGDKAGKKGDKGAKKKAAKKK